MAKHEETLHSVLIVTGSQQTDAGIRRALPVRRVMNAEHRGSAAAARRCLLERFYDIVIIDAPLPDEDGVDLALDTAESGRVSVMILAPADRFHEALERVTDAGILAVPKPTTRGRVNQGVRFMLAVQDRIRGRERETEAVSEKLEELRIVSKAKFYLVEHRRMTEDEAHRLIGREAMNHGISRRRAAERILDEL